MEMFIHKPVLLNETLDALNCKKNGFYLDCTVGGGGHSSEILKLVSDGFLFCLDRDFNAIKAAKKSLDNIGKNYRLLKESYINLESVVTKNNLPLLDGILFDLGVSSPQLDQVDRGFSFSKDAPLDMRFGQDEETTLTAADLINMCSEDELVKIFSEYGEEPYSKTIASAIVRERKKEKVKTTGQLSNIIVNSLAGKKFKGHIHPATRVFQALRIKVNNELEGLKEVLPVSLRFLKTGGRLSVISFHSLEDRIVKEAFKEATLSCICPPRQPVCTCNKVSEGKLVTKKPITATEQEIKANPRSRSAKLRVIEKL